MRKNLKTKNYQYPPPNHPQRVSRILPKASPNIYVTYPNERPNLVWIAQTVFAELETKAVILFVSISRILKNSKNGFLPII
jgi:hypothetical protein